MPGGRPRKGKDLRVLTAIRFDPDLWKRIKEEAEQQDKTTADIIHEAVMAYFGKTDRKRD